MSLNTSKILCMHVCLLMNMYVIHVKKIVNNLCLQWHKLWMLSNLQPYIHQTKTTLNYFCTAFWAQHTSPDVDLVQNIMHPCNNCHWLFKFLPKDADSWILGPLVCANKVTRAWVTAKLGLVKAIWSDVLVKRTRWPGRCLSLLSSIRPVLRPVAAIMSSCMIKTTAQFIDLLISLHIINNRNMIERIIQYLSLYSKKIIFTVKDKQ